MRLREEQAIWNYLVHRLREEYGLEGPAAFRVINGSEKELLDADFALTWYVHALQGVGGCRDHLEQLLQVSESGCIPLSLQRMKKELAAYSIRPPLEEGIYFFNVLRFAHRLNRELWARNRESDLAA